MHPAIITLVPDTQKLAGKIAAALGGEIRHGAGQITAAYAAGQPVIGICAAAILIRKLAPLLDEKHTSSPVIAVSADGAHIVPLTGGHHGANTLARKIATITGGTAAITTASDTRFGVALDDPPAGYTLANPQDAKPFIMQLLNGEKVQIQAEAEWLKDSRLPTGPDATLSIDVTTSPACGGPDRLVYHPKTVCIGVGCARGAPS
ncbi:MAG TPA: precorrin-3B C(17)-methyltransferase, partial [Rhizobiales bacterium]|nr:precorrin-3B C(17)-methyltransferase [Hyphomicrobiales bacterium]